MSSCPHTSRRTRPLWTPPANRRHLPLTPASRRHPGRTLGVLALALTLACGGSDGPSAPQGPGNGSMTATVNGKSWKATRVNAGPQEGAIGIYGMAGDNSEIVFAIMLEGVGTYSIPASTGLNFNYIEASTGHQWQALAMGPLLGGVGTGTVTLSTLTDDRVAGTFSFQAPPIAQTGATTNVTVTSGAFDITF